MAKTDLLAIASPGSRALKNTKYEKYCRLRASAQPRIPAYREAGKRAMMMMLTAKPVGLSVALGLGSALNISRIKKKS
jgi:hypothetical protein